MGQLYFLFICIASLIFSISLTRQASADWLSLQNGPEHTGSADYFVGDNLQVMWTSKNFNSIPHSPAVKNGDIYLPIEAGLVALDSQGNTKWTFSSHTPNGAPTISSNGDIFFTTSGCSPHVYALDQNGNKKWNYDIRQNRGVCGEYSSSGGVTLSKDEKTLYLGLTYPLSSLLALNASEGTVKWQTKLSGWSPWFTTPAVSSDGTIYIGTGSIGFFFAVNSDGTIKWQRYVGSGTAGESHTPLVDPSGNVYVTRGGATGGDVIASFSANGNQRWIYQTKDTSITTHPVLKDNTIFITETRNIIALDASSGNQHWVWTAPKNAYLASPVIDANGSILVPAGDILYILDKNGSLKNSIQVGNYLNSVIIGGDNLVYVTQNGQNLGALHALTYKSAKTPLIFIPGIGGSELKVKNDVIWSAPDGHGDTFNHAYLAGEKVWVNEFEAAKPGHDDYFDILRMKPDGLNSEAELELTGELFSGAYKSTVDFFEANGYKLNQDFFTFPYDWRKDITLTEPLLNQKIENIKKRTGTEKVDIVAHSMGGLVARNYIQKPNGPQNVRRLVTLGTPYLGSPNTLKQLLYGACLPAFEILSSPVCFGVSPSEAKDVLQNMITAFKLLPSKSYYKLYSGEDNNHPLPFADNADIDQNGASGPLDYNKTKELLKNLGLNKALLDYAEAFHELDNSLGNAGATEVSIIAGSGQPTLGQIIAKGTKKDLIIVNGDKTVPLFSASMEDPGKNLNFHGNSKVYYSKQNHGSLAQNGPALQLALNMLKDDSNIPYNIASKPFELEGTLLSVHSPIDIHIYDHNGAHTGPAANGGFEENIPESVYDTLDDTKYIWLPNSGEYKISMNATSQGSFDFKILSYSHDSAVKTITYSGIPLTQDTRVTSFLDTNASPPPKLKIDSDNDGSTDKEIENDSVPSPANGTSADPSQTPGTNVLGITFKDPDTPDKDQRTGSSNGAEGAQPTVPEPAHGPNKNKYQPLFSFLKIPVIFLGTFTVAFATTFMKRPKVFKRP